MQRFSYTIFYTVNYTRLLKGLLSILLIIILAFFAGGVVKTALYMRDLIHEGVETTTRAVIIVHTLILLALLEIIRIILAYFQENRVRVLFVVDTVFIIMSAEVVSFWFKNGPTVQVLFLSAVLITLVIVRVLTIKFSAKKLENTI